MHAWTKVFVQKQGRGRTPVRVNSAKASWGPVWLHLHWEARPLDLGFSQVCTVKFLIQNLGDGKHHDLLVTSKG